MTADSTQQIVNGINAASIDDSGKKPRLVVCGAPAEGHIGPMVRVARELSQRGYPMTVVTGEEFRSQVESIGGADLFTVPPMYSAEQFAQRELIPAGVARLAYDMQEIFVGSIPERWAGLKHALETLRERNPEEEIVILTEPFFFGANPLIFGAPLPKGFDKRPKVIKLGITPYVASSIDVGPAGPGLPPDATESGRARNGLLITLFKMGPFAGPIAAEAKIMKELGAVDFVPDDLLTGWLHAPDVLLQMAPPSIEYPRSDMPEMVKFIGSLPPKPLKAGFEYPSWWADVTKGDKKVVMVTQGTVQLNYTDLILPTMEALAGRDDLLVVAVLGVKGATLPADAQVPANARVVDYLSYDALLSHADVFVGNAGYGGFLHGLTNGVPMVLAGTTEDKAEVSMRGEWSGVAVNLRTSTPTAGQVGEAVNKILGDSKYKARTMAIKEENEGLKTVDQIEVYIRQMTKA
ncbi:N-glycosyltransferase [Paramyrothecium foliicola]|nr:N-glycosyltransferase [Paramyrothecium foliicola]